MMSVPTLPGITARTVNSSRLATRVLFSGPDEGTPVIFVHGNVSSATFWEDTMLALPTGYRGIAPDQRGFGEADPASKIDSTRGLADLSDDLAALMDALNIERAHVVGHSAGGSVLWQFLMTYPGRVLTCTMAAPGSPYGFGGSRPDGTPIYPDSAGSGGGTVNPDFPRLLAEGERSDAEASYPRSIMNTFYWKPPFRPAREEDYLSSMLSTHVGPEDYPGDMTPSDNWPNVAPGTRGLINGLAPKYQPAIDGLYRIDPKPAILWIRGAEDQIVSNQSFFELGMLGMLGAVPGWPGAEAYPPQPMIDQTRAVLEAYQQAGGVYQEVVLEECGHSPFIEKPGDFNTAFHGWLGR